MYYNLLKIRINKYKDMLYVVGYQKDISSKRQVKICLKESKAHKIFDKMKECCLYVALLQYGKSAEDYKIIATYPDNNNHKPAE